MRYLYYKETDNKVYGIFKSKMTQFTDPFIVIEDKTYDELDLSFTENLYIKADGTLEKKSIQIPTTSSIANTAEVKTRVLRNKRTKLLNAFDTYKTNVAYGITAETDDRKAIILAWYRNILDLVENAFEDNNIPAEIRYYL